MFSFLAKLFKRKTITQIAEQQPPAEPQRMAAFEDDGGLQMDDGDLEANVSFDDDSPLTAEELNMVSKQTDKQ
ncbi:phosphoglucosamine mutase [Neisseria elongata]|uniref:phosphoglucosamine mutase n=1 Tax=Neisseria elongata TaxID=495 RepID=UPI000D3B5037|nr:phosphoglucosamine mutase [Neisseria elongata]